jgi:hypothetical protein
MTRALELPRALLAGALIAASTVRGSLPLAAQAHPAIHTKADAMTLLVPESMQAEHREIHDALDRATKVRGSVGTAARELAKVLGPHFVREEQIALPPLGLLAPLARGEFTPAMLEVLPLTIRSEPNSPACFRSMSRFTQPRRDWPRRRATDTMPTHCASLNNCSSTRRAKSRCSIRRRCSWATWCARGQHAE